MLTLEICVRLCKFIFLESFSKGIYYPKYISRHLSQMYFRFLCIEKLNRVSVLIYHFDNK